jgi:predicted ribosome quality control (RQC) complex YloA/Tae2 family protein
MATQTQTERVTYLTNAEQKAALEAFARARGESVGSVLRDAVAEYLGQPSAAEEAELIALTQQVNEAIPRMNAKLERISATIRDLRAENDAFFRDKGIRS